MSELYSYLIDFFIKEEYKDEVRKLVEQRYDESITLKEDKSSCVSYGCYSDGTIYFIDECIARTLLCVLSANCRFGEPSVENANCKSPDPDRPFLTLHTTVRIPFEPC